MSSDVAVRLENVSKTFMVRENASRSIRGLVRQAFQQRGPMKKIEAVQNVDLDIYKGEFFGIIGRNGSGKSTLLKLILGTLRPDPGGAVSTDGVVLRLALGMGFDGNLSARENIYLNGSIIGLTFKRIGEIFEEIVRFSELEDYVNTPVKYFSSGMRSRLAFSIAIHAEADILLIDEFFGGVGDIAFKKKSEAVFKSTLLSGRTIIYVTHQLQHIRKYCHRAAILNEGHLSLYDDPDLAIKTYRNMFSEKA